MPSDGAPAGPAPVATKNEGGVTMVESANMASCGSTDPDVVEAQKRWLENDPQAKARAAANERAIEMVKRVGGHS